MFSDIALIHNNAKVGSQIACALSKQMNGGKHKGNTRRHGKSDSDSDIVSINTHDGPNFLVKYGQNTLPTMLFCYRLS